jgi:hypothetical protein
MSQYQKTGFLFNADIILVVVLGIINVINLKCLVDIPAPGAIHTGMMKVEGMVSTE